MEFGSAPGSVVLLDSDEMAARFPQISTHKISLGLLSKQIEANGQTQGLAAGGAAGIAQARTDAPLSPRCVQSCSAWTLTVLQAISAKQYATEVIV